MAPHHPPISVIIPFYKKEAYLKQCIERCLALDYPNYEVIVVSDRNLMLDVDKVRLITVDSPSQGHKKDAGALAALGELVAYIDDDAYPSRDWLKNAARYFDMPDVVAVCGPGVTPPEDSIMQRASGAILSSIIGSGPLRFRYVPTRIRFIDEGPGYNMIINRSFLLRIGGFSTSLRSGDDTLLSQKIRDAGKKILYAPDVIVYHHRRPLFLPHLRQITNYGFHRGFFAKRFRRLSARLLYFVPSSLFVGSLLISLALPVFGQVLLLGFALYLGLSFISALSIERNLKVAFLAMIGTPLTHLAYSYGFLQGLIARSIGQRPSH